MDFKRAYEILDIDETASFSEIKIAYRDLASIWHPDRHSNNSRLAEKALQKMKEINAAYDLLSTLFTEIDRTKSKERQEEVITVVKCKRCGTQNRIKNIEGVAFKCGKCRNNLFDEQSYSDDSERILCGDGECIGIIRNGRCTVCGKTLEEGIKEDELKSKIHQEQYYKRQVEEKRKEKIKNAIKILAISAVIIFFIYAIYSDFQNSESKRNSTPSNRSELIDYPKSEVNIDYKISQIEFTKHNYSVSYIEILQKYLKNLGYDTGVVDGIAGHKTIEACNTFINDFKLISKINSIETLLLSLKIHNEVTKTYTDWPSIVRKNLLINWVMKQPDDFRNEILSALKSDNAKYFIVILRFYTFDNEKPPEQILPEDGVYWQSFENGIAPLKISTRDKQQNHYIKIVDSRTNKEILKAFLRGGHFVEFDVPLGTYIIKYAAGAKWYGERFLFGPYTAYGKADKVFAFKKVGYQVSGYSIELYLQPHGNLHTSTINAFQF